MRCSTGKRSEVKRQTFGSGETNLDFTSPEMAVKQRYTIGKSSSQRKKTRGLDAILGNVNIQGLNEESDAGESERG